MVNNQQFKHLHKDKLCFHCNELQENIKIFTMKDRNEDIHSTIFDGDEFDIQLCDKCISKLKVEKDWFHNGKSYDKYTDSHMYEDKILEIIESFPIHNQEYCLNIDNNLSGIKKIDRKDWIRMYTKNPLHL